MTTPMHKRVAALAMVFTFLAPASALARRGGQDGGGHGGGTIHCENPNARIHVEMKIVKDKRYLIPYKPASVLPHGRDFELTDLWEAENGYGPFRKHKSTIPWIPERSKDDWLSLALNKLASFDLMMAVEVQGIHQHISHRMFSVGTNDRLILPDDTDILYLPKGCDTTGVGAYSDRSDALAYNPELLAQLPPMDQAAFELHEAVYKYMRDNKGAQSSWDSRRMVAMLFTLETFSRDEFFTGFPFEP